MALRIMAGKNKYFARVTQALLHFQKGMDKLSPWDDCQNRHKWADTVYALSKVYIGNPIKTGTMKLNKQFRQGF